MSVVATCYECTDIGRVRPTNEDYALCFAPGVCLVADGMGGHAAGEVASSLLAHTVQSYLGTAERPWDESVLLQSVQAANTAIRAEASAFSGYDGMGTTATIFSYADGQGIWAHVGDSRLYLFRNGILRQLTHDHSYVEGLVENGSITEEEARVHPQKNVLTRAVGVEEDVLVDTGRFDITRGDVVLLSTDGLTNMLPDAKIAEILAQSSSDPSRVLVGAANEAGGRDNITAVVVVFS